MASSFEPRTALASADLQVRQPSTRWRRAALAMVGALVLGPLGSIAPATAAFKKAPFLAKFGSSSEVTPTTKVGSTVPGNGDVNPYGLAEVDQSVGKLVAGDALISNFNNAKNKQGTGTTIVELSPTGGRTTFAAINPAALPGRCPGGVGLTTALTILPGGWVVVGSLPAPGGLPANMGPGCLLVLNDMGHVVETWSGGPINGPWDMTSVASGGLAELFVTNVLNGTVAGAGVADPNTQTGHIVFGGTVARLVVSLSLSGPPALVSATTIAAGFAQHTDPSALVVGPTGVGLSSGGTLYVNDTVENRIVAVPDALLRQTPIDPATVVTKGGALNGPLGMTIAPNGDLLTVNGGDSRIVETTPGGHQVDTLDLGNPASPGTDLGGGALFGLTVGLDGTRVLVVDDLNNFLDVLG